MKLIMLPVLAGVVLLAGCAGGKSTFDCGATAGDQCMTMQQANEKAAMMTTAKRGGGAKSLPVVAKPSLTVPSAPQASSPGVTVPPARSGTGMTPAAGTGKAATAPTSPRPVVRPLRVAERTGKIWVAAWVDKDGAYHADNMISVVTRPGEWN